jgi:hypothetical protein
MTQVKFLGLALSKWMKFNTGSLLISVEIIQRIKNELFHSVCLFTFDSKRNLFEHDFFIFIGFTLKCYVGVEGYVD